MTPPAARRGRAQPLRQGCRDLVFLHMRYTARSRGRLTSLFRELTPFGLGIENPRLGGSNSVLGHHRSATRAAHVPPAIRLTTDHPRRRPEPRPLRCFAELPPGQKRLSPVEPGRGQPRRRAGSIGAADRKATCSLNADPHRAHQAQGIAGLHRAWTQSVVEGELPVFETLAEVQAFDSPHELGR